MVLLPRGHPAAFFGLVRCQGENAALNALMVSDDDLKRELLEMDVRLRRKQDIWEHPRNIAILVGAVAAIAATVAGLAGYKIGSAPPPTIIIQTPAPK